MDDSVPNYYRYWGKADADGAYRLLPYHCLDVAAVGKIILDRNPVLLKQVSISCGIETKILKPILIFFLALHDLGKFSESFQCVVPELFKKLHGKENSFKHPYSKRFCHGSIGYLLWRDWLFSRFLDLMGLENDQDQEDWRDLLRWFLEASNGHHGSPVKQDSHIITDFYGDDDKQAALKFIKDLISLFSLKTTFPDYLIKDYERIIQKLRQASWAITGFMVICDWIGSGKKFKYVSDEPSIKKYWNDTALKVAEEAVIEAGVLPCSTNKQLDPLNELLDLPENSRLTPLQEICSDITIVEKPQLFIIEDQTGSGKTEASLILINRLMALNQAQGFYLALPTMATADGIFPRVQKTYSNLYHHDEKPSLVLSHSLAKLGDRFSKTIISPEHSVSEQKYGDDAQSRCQLWLADNRKKALLANVGVGTIDQAFFATLKTKYQSLRLVGLIGKILVIDEAHAYDAYMGKELEVLLRVHAAFGGNAIIMSATLPFATRQKLVNAFLKGANSRNIKLKQRKTYPLLTHVAANHVIEKPLRFKAKDGKDQIGFRFLKSEDKCKQVIQESIKRGQCVCWIRNSVKDARETFFRFKKMDYKVELFHARFTIADRLMIQDRILNAFGKKSRHEQRCGRLVIATQVVEQSLDLDFDVIITDLAPIDLMLQRAGRMRRHIRDKLGNPKENGFDERGEAIFFIHTPDYAEEPKETWFSSFFPNAKRVYENHARLWLGLKNLSHLSEPKLPKNIRALIENVYDKEAEIPKNLSKSDEKAEGNEQGRQTMGCFNTIDFENGYTMEGRLWPEDLKMPTRLGEDTKMVTLAKWEGGKLKPFNSVKKQPWRNSEIRVLEKNVTTIPEYNEDIQKAYSAIENDLSNQGKWTYLIPMTWNAEIKLWEGAVIDERTQTGRIYYHSQKGLIYDYEMEILQADNKLETEVLI